MSLHEHMREYETIYIMRPELDDKAAKEALLAKKDLIEKLGGKNLKVTAMARKKLSWERKKEDRGIFVHHHFLGKPGIIKDWDRALFIDEQILHRHSVLLKTNVDPNLAKVEEDVLIPPVFKEKKEFGDRRHFGQRGDFGDFGRSRDFGFEEEEDNFGDDN